MSALPAIDLGCYRAHDLVMKSEPRGLSWQQLLAIDLAAALLLTFALGSDGLSAGQLTGRFALLAVLLPFAWPLWLLAYGLGTLLLRFLRGPKLFATPAEMLTEWERRWGPLTPDMRERFLARPQLTELSELPRRRVLAEIRRQRGLADVLDAVAAAEKVDPTPAPRLLLRWAAVGALAFLGVQSLTGTNAEEQRPRVPTATTTFSQYIDEILPAYSCGAGSYTNVNGDCIPGPVYSSSGVPAGASARCRDGTYSFSQNRQGTCSHHGGVACWLP